MYIPLHMSQTSILIVSIMKDGNPMANVFQIYLYPVGMVYANQMKIVRVVHKIVVSVEMATVIILKVVNHVQMIVVLAHNQTLVAMEFVILEKIVEHVQAIVATVLQPHSVVMEHVILVKTVAHVQAIAPADDGRRDCAGP